MNTWTNVLLAIIAGILLLKFFPDVGVPVVTIVVIGAVAYGVYWFFFRARARLNADNKKREQDASDRVLFDEFRVQHTAIRKKYDPEHKWNEATSLPRDYVEEMAELNERYKDVLVRKYGDHILNP